jgi:Endodeoxyribonuclease RusA
MDADNIQKPTLDALQGVAYVNDAQVRHVDSTVFDRNDVGVVNGRVEHIGRLFYTPHPHVVLIRIYSDSRLEELGGAPAVSQKRYDEWAKDFDAALRQASLDAAKVSEDEFIPSAGVYREKSTGFYVCPRCLADNKRSRMTEEPRAYRCPVCEGYFPDSEKQKALGPVQPVRGTSWLSSRRRGGYRSRADRSAPRCKLSANRTAKVGRGDWIRTSDPLRPRQVRYQAALRPDLRRFLMLLRICAALPFGLCPAAQAVPGRPFARGSVFRVRLVGVAPQPTLAGLGGGDDGMAGRAGVLGGVPVRRVVAAVRAAARLTRAEVDPAPADLHAFVALAGAGGLHLADLLDMGTRVWHTSTRLA